jgi:hypothetical protein
MLRCVALVRTVVPEECITSIRVTIGKLGMLAATSNQSMLQRNTADSCQPDDGGDMFLWNVGSYKCHMA